MASGSRVLRAQSGSWWAASGQSTVEFALVGVVYLSLILGVIDYGRLLYTYSLVSYSAREASRYASVNGSTSKHPAQAADVKTVVQNEFSSLDTSNNKLSVTTTWSPNNAAGSVVTVKVQYTFTHMIPMLSLSSVVLTSSSKMVLSQ